MSIQFPNVPNLPGVPQMARSALFPPTPAPTAGSQALSGQLWQSTRAAPVWGIFDSSNKSVLAADSFQDFGWRQEYRVSNFPVQQGAFASYNKVRTPFEASIIATKGGTLNQRNAFLAQVDTLVSSLSLYTIMTPEKSYLSVNITRAELARRGSANAYYFDVELFFVEVVEITPQYSATVNASVASATPATNRGLNNATTPSTAVQTAVTKAIS